MYRHAIPPARFFSQMPNEIIRHPRLSSYAVRLLLWQPSLPDSANEPLYESAQRAWIKKAAFNRAKRELLAEGYLHEWRRQDGSGRRYRPQVISNVPLTVGETLAVRDGRVPDLQPKPQPTAAEPAVGEPVPRAVGRSPKNTEGHTSHPPHHPLADRSAQALAGITRDRLVRKMPEPAPDPKAAPNPPLPCSGPCGRVFRPAVDEDRCRDCRRAAAPHDTSTPVAATHRGTAAVRDALALAPTRRCHTEIRTGGDVALPLA